ncbi:MAG: 16S rRNA (guanine(527)-N(7))-methyltransferase RsmG [Defluviitaleaceae bacterium]|nr:16S rRNA (guanine(527)-N(7))-methyltransferase RsmG [Defluviitaleaceae bacterium]
MDLKNLLKNGADMLGVALDDAQIETYWAYKDFLKQYNEKVNLTAITDDEGIVIKHFLDCLTVVPHIGGGRVIDVGTGAGLPGLVVKIARPDIDLTLLDARAKKVKFLEEAALLLNLENVKCIHGRAEDVQKKVAAFDYATTRAVGQMDALLGWCLPFVKSGGTLIAMKGPNYKDEMEAGMAKMGKLRGKLASVETLTLPNTDITRNLIIIHKN